MANQDWDEYFWQRNEVRSRKERNAKPIRKRRLSLGLMVLLTVGLMGPSPVPAGESQNSVRREAKQRSPKFSEKKQDAFNKQRQRQAVEDPVPDYPKNRKASFKFEQPDRLGDRAPVSKGKRPPGFENKQIEPDRSLPDGDEKPSKPKKKKNKPEKDKSLKEKLEDIPEGLTEPEANEELTSNKIKVTDLPDEKRELEFTTGPARVKDEKGDWQDISGQLVEDPANPGTFEPEVGISEVEVADDIEGEIVGLETDAGRFSLSLPDIQARVKRDKSRGKKYQVGKHFLRRNSNGRRQAPPPESGSSQTSEAARDSDPNAEPTSLVEVLTSGDIDEGVQVEIEPGEGIVGYEEITYPEAIGEGAHLVEQALPEGFEESVVVETRKGPKKYRVVLTMPEGVTAEKIPAGIEFKDAQGNPVALYGSAVAIDSAEVPSEGGVDLKIKKIKGQQITIEIMVDKKWWKDKARVFPIVIDPTFTKSTTNTSASGDTYINSTYPNSNYYNSTELKVGSYNGSYVAESELLFNLGAIDSTSAKGAGRKPFKIHNADLKLYTLHSGTCHTNPYTRMYVMRMKNWYGPFATWNNRGDRNTSSWWARRNFVAGHNECPPDAWKSLDMTNFATGMVQNDWNNKGFKLVAEYNNVYGWKKFASGNSWVPPKFTVTYSKYDAAYGQPRSWRRPANQPTTVPITVTNQSSHAWAKNGSFKLAYKLLDKNNKPYGSAIFTEMPKWVYPGQSVTIQARVNGYNAGARVIGWSIVRVKNSGPWDWFWNYDRDDVRADTLISEPAFAFGTGPYSAVDEGVSTVNGNYHYQQTDAEIAGPGPALEMTRSHNTMDSGIHELEWFGKGWTSTYETRLINKTDRGIALRHPDGRQDYFKKLNNGKYKAPPSTSARLIKQANGSWTLKDLDNKTFYFAPYGRLERIKDQTGNKITVQYSAGKPSRIYSTGSNRSLYLKWNAEDHIKEIRTDSVNGAPLVHKYTYNSNEKLVKYCTPRSTAANPVCWTYAYDSGKLDKIIKPDGKRYMTLSYFDSGNPWGITNGVFTRKDGRGHQWAYVYATHGKDHGFEYRAGVLEPNDEVRQWAHNRAGHLVRETDQAGHETKHLYNSRGFLSKTTDPLGRSETFKTDDSGNVTEHKDTAGKTEYRTYYGESSSAENQVRSLRSRRSTSATDNTYRTYHEYNSQGNLDRKVSPSPHGTSVPVETWTYSFDANSALDGGYTPPGLMKTYNDPRGQVTKYKYTKDGDQVKTISPTGLVTEVTYDNLGRPIETKTICSDCDVQETTTTTEYDKDGNVIREVGPRIDNPDGTWHQLETTYEYDLNNNLTKKTESDLNPEGDEPRVTQSFYNDNDVENKTIDPEGGVITTTHDDVGNPTTVIDQAGTVLETTYNTRNWPIEEWLRDYQDPHDPDSVRDIRLKRTFYNKMGLPYQEIDPLGRTTSISYDSAYRETSRKLLNFEKHPDNGGGTKDLLLVAKTYDPDGNVITERSGEGQGARLTINWGRDPAGNIFKQMVGLGNDEHDLIITRRNQLGGVKSECRSRGNGCSDDNNSNTGEYREVRSTYGPDNKPIRQVVEFWNEDMVTRYDRDQKGNVLRSTDPRMEHDFDSPDYTPEFTTSYAYNAAGQLIRSTAPNADIYEVDPSTGEGPDSADDAPEAEPTSETSYNSWGDVTATTDPKGNTTKHTFDRLGRETQITHPAYTPPGGEEIAPTETMAYDAVGNLRLKTGRRGYTTEFFFDQRNQVYKQIDPVITGQSEPGITKHFYDDAGRETALVDPRGARTEQTYDMADRVRTKTTFIRQPEGDPVQSTTSHDYTDTGEEIWTKDANGNISTSTVDRLGRTLSSTDPAGNTTSFTYNVSGEIADTIQPSGRKVTNVYNKADFLKEVKAYGPNGNLQKAENRKMDWAGNQIEVTTPRGQAQEDPDGNQTGWHKTFEYDSLNRLTKVVEPISEDETIETSYGYDAQGNHTKTTDGQGSTTWTTYNSWNLPELRIEPPTDDTPEVEDRTYALSYDEGGLTETKSEPGGYMTGWAYDELGNKIVETGLKDGDEEVRNDFYYDQVGNQTKASHPEGELSFTFDDRNLMIEAQGPAGNATFTRDLNGNITAQSDPSGTSAFTYNSRNLLKTTTEALNSYERSYSYDNDGRITQVDLGNQGAKRNLAWDPLGRLQADELKDANDQTAYLAEYTYDANDNVTEETTTKQVADTTYRTRNDYSYDYNDRLVESQLFPDQPNENSVTQKFSYDDADRRTEVETQTRNNSGEVTDTETDSFEYDERNMLKEGPEGEYDWTSRGTLETVEKDGATKAYEFDALGRMVKAEGISYTYDAYGRIADRESDSFEYVGTSIDPTKTGDETISRSPNGTPYALDDTTGGTKQAVLDRHGDLVAWHNNDGTLNGARSYDPYGEPEDNGDIGER